MKKTLCTLATISFALASLGMVSCHDVIFSEIRNEVELSDAQVSGDINSIVRFKMPKKVTTTNDDGTMTTNTEDHEFLFVQNGNIYYKDVDAAAKGSPTLTSPYEGQWVKAAETGMDANFIIRLAADETYLYALGGKVEANDDSGDMEPTKKAVYCSTDGDTWEEVSFADAVTVSATARATLFCSNTPQAAHRKAFITYGSKLYELSGTTATDATETYASTDWSAGKTKTTDSDGNTITTQTSGASACAYFDGTYYFYGGYALITNETKDSDATYIYRSSGDNIQYTTTPPDNKSDNNPWSSFDTDVTIYSLAYTADYMLVGSASGLIHVTLQNAEGETPKTIPTAVAESPKNASSTLSSYYDVYNIIAVDSALSATEGDLYGTTVFSGTTSSTGASTDNVGLWAYYPGRGNWNRE